MHHHADIRRKSRNERREAGFGAIYHERANEEQSTKAAFSTGKETAIGRLVGMQRRRRRKGKAP
jgi:hypothetical protein